MGCQTDYYKIVIQNFAYYLTCHTNMELAKKLSKERDSTKLEKFIMDMKSNMPTEDFFYNAGMAFMYTLNNADKYDGCDGFNACFGGLNMFEILIGLRKGKV